jgi:hypothetical protein
MTDARTGIFRAVETARGSKLDGDQRHALHNLLDALSVPLERPEPTEWR